MQISLKEINRLAIPAIIAGISEPIISLGDTAILGRLPDSELVLSAIGNATSFYLTIVWVLAQSKSAISALIARAFGANQLNRTQTLVTQGILLNIGLGLLSILCTTPFSAGILSTYELDRTALKYATAYYNIRALGFPLILATFAMFGVFRGLQNTLWAMMISISGALLNLILDYVLVYGVEGLIEPLHVRGAAYASLISQAYMFIVTVTVLLRKTPYKIRLTMRINYALPELVQITTNLFLRTIMLNVAIYLANRTATDIGNAYNSAHQMAWQFWIFSAFFLDGFANAGNAISGKLLGQNQFGTLRQLVKQLIGINMAIGAGISIILAITYFKLGYLLTNNESLILIFESFFWLILIIIPLNAVAFTLDGVFKGLGEARYLRNVLTISTLAGFVPTLFITQHFEMGLYGIWLAFIIWILMRGLLPWVQVNKYIDTKINQ